ncbi:CBS domain-containing protein [Altererythrobacter aurantiacus]|uniref:CBS domain-containing protein n=1 Tax=Parapontixanthobacter aurantiacus TaxID=1463599 RepID=A0A844ZIQ1_9SPHN|nr:CBS domain-containing protein [Parapontixanthobacter aurantiacus]MXO86860.1 CBS domain-containing protein [Parapontixanthobacter aurantiacus]
MQIAHLVASRNVDDIVSCTPEMSVIDAVARLAERRIGAMPVIDNGTVVGIFSERDVIYRLAQEGKGCIDTTVGAIMSTPAITVSRSTSVDDALALMTRRRIRHLPVLNGDAMCGFISIGDLVKERYAEVEHEAQAMRQYIQT